MAGIAGSKAEEEPCGDDEEYGQCHHSPAGIGFQPIDNYDNEFDFLFFCCKWFYFNAEQLLDDGVDDGDDEEHLHGRVTNLSTAADIFSYEVSRT